MNKNTNNNQIPDEAIKLLPWYATGLLSPEEHAYLQEIESNYPGFQELLNSEREIIRLVSEDKTLLEQSALESTEDRLERVLEKIGDNSEQSAASNAQESSTDFSTRIKNFFNSWFEAPSKLQYANYAIMTVVTIALFSAFLAPLLNQNSTFQPATSKTSETKIATTATILLVGINGNAETLKTFKPLQESFGKMEAVPGKKGMFRVSLKQKLNPSQTEELIKSLLAQKELVWFAGEAY